MSKMTRPPETKNLSEFPDQLRQVLNPAGRGVVGVVDDLLSLCPEQGLQFDWHANHCQIHPLHCGPQEMIEVPLPRSVFRAILARVATLCNERKPNSVSPYGGQGELAGEADPTAVFWVAFTNTPGEQKLTLRPEQRPN